MTELLIMGRPYVRTKSRKIGSSPLVRKMSALAQPPLSCSCGRTINFEKSEVFLL